MEVSQSLKQANPLYLVAAALITSLGYFLRAARWQKLLQPITESSLKELFATTTVGFSAVFLIGRAGEIVRPMWLPMRDRRVRPSTALVSLFIERLFDLASLICFFAVNLLWFQAPLGREDEFRSVEIIGVLMLAGVAFGCFCLYLYQKFSAPLIGWFERNLNRRFIPKRLQAIFLNLLKQLAGALKILRDWRETLALVGWTILLWLSIAVPTWLVILAFDIPMGFSGALFVMGWAAIGSIVPTPGGAAGAFHAVTANALIFLGTDRELSYAVSFAMHLVYFAPALFFGIYYFLHGDISIARFKNLISSEHAVEEIESESPNSKAELQSSS